ncbi:putative RAB36 member RAS oncogene family protein [Paratrimastix pyriformis]|uniref:RAB36 member RAS oncogene family protein n=1 Tax=Paratrimastix pyriformis TaxID=342808 RepID=A0ABQ8UGS7_9EUKA|nr:putative RAB36 member RAS oncogene family protein [Paratrimastix pyriformis]
MTLASSPESARKHITLSGDRIKLRALFAEVPPTAEYRMKVLFLGSYAVGKTSMLLRFFKNQFVENLSTTIGVDFFSLSCDYGPDFSAVCKLECWDTAGNEQFRAMSPQYYRGADAVVLCFDLARKKSLDDLAEFYQQAQLQNKGRPLNVFIVGCKKDRFHVSPVIDAEAQRLAAEWGAQGRVYYTSSKVEEGGVTKLFNDVAGCCFEQALRDAAVKLPAVEIRGTTPTALCPPSLSAATPPPGGHSTIGEEGPAPQLPPRRIELVFTRVIVFLCPPSTCLLSLMSVQPRGRLPNNNQMRTSLTLPREHLNNDLEPTSLSVPPQKVLLMGPSSVGKTSMIDRFFQYQFTEQIRGSPLGVDFFSLSCDYGPEMPDAHFRLTIWKVPVPELISTLSRSSYPGAAAVVLCYDLSRPGTLGKLAFLRQEVLEMNQGRAVKVFLVGCKKVSSPRGSHPHHQMKGCRGGFYHHRTVTCRHHPEPPCAVIIHPASPPGIIHPASPRADITPSASPEHRCPPSTIPCRIFSWGTGVRPPIDPEAQRLARDWQTQGGVYFTSSKCDDEGEGGVTKLISDVAECCYEQAIRDAAVRPPAVDVEIRASKSAGLSSEHLASDGWVMLHSVLIHGGRHPKQRHRMGPRTRCLLIWTEVVLLVPLAVRVLSMFRVFPVSITPVCITPVCITPVAITPVSITPVSITLVSITPHRCPSPRRTTRLVATWEKRRSHFPLKTTIGVEFHPLDCWYGHRFPESLFHLDICDTAGMVQFQAMSKLYYSEADAVVLCFDLHRKDTLDALGQWRQLIRAENGRSKLFLVGCKKDLYQTTSQGPQALRLSEEWQAPLYYTSSRFENAVEGGVTKLFSDVAEYCYQRTLMKALVKQRAKVLHPISAPPRPPVRPSIEPPQYCGCVCQ